MLLWKRYLLAGTFFFVYSLFTLRLFDISPECQQQQQLVRRCVRDLSSNNTNSYLLKKILQQQSDKVILGDRGTAVENRSLSEKIIDGLKRNEFGFKRKKGRNLAPDGIMGSNQAKKASVVYEEVEVAPVTQLLNPANAPNTVFYVWCGKRWLEFSHYLSVLSVIKILKPDNLIFYYDNLPILDSWMYNTWFKELNENYPFFIPTKLEESENACKGLAQPNVDFIHSRLQKTGGMYISEFVILNTYPLTFRTYDFIYAVYNGSKYAFVQSKQSTPIYELIKNPLETGFKTRHFTCESHAKYNDANKPICVVPPTNLFPKDVWESNKPFASLVRRHFYGSPEVKLPQKDYSNLIPNIAHIVWIGGGQMDFLFYLGVVSLVYVAQVDIVYIHGDLPPSGPYWERIRRNKKVQHIYRAVPATVYGTEVNILSHVTDVWRVDFMIKYGGIYVDTDTAFVRPLDRDIRAYDAVGTYDWTYWNHPFPDTINFGVAIGKRNATFWHLFQKSMRWFVDKDWSWNGLRQPYRIKERHPELVLINPHLQITCYQFKCHPTWWPGYHKEEINHLNSQSIKDWRSEAYAFHWTMPTPPELENEEALVNSDTMFADIGRYILHKAGILKADNRTIVYPNGRELKLNMKAKS